MVDNDVKGVSLKELYLDKTKQLNFYLGSMFVEYAVKVDLLSIEMKKEWDENNQAISHRYVLPTPEAKLILDQENISAVQIPTSLPMVCVPQKWAIDKDGKYLKYGGYLWNDTRGLKDIFYWKPSHIHNPLLHLDAFSINAILEGVNGLSSVPYKINLEVLKYVMKYGVKENILIDYNSPELVKFRKSGLTFNTKKGSKDVKLAELKALNDKSALQLLTINIAAAYAGAEFIYFPLELDFRTRHYNSCYALSYQGSDLAKALLLFKVPGLLLRNDN